MASLEPTLAGFVADLGHRVRDVAAGWETAEPVDGVRVSGAGPDSVAVRVSVSVGGRPATEVSMRVALDTRTALERQLGVRVERVEVLVVAEDAPVTLPPGVDQPWLSADEDVLRVSLVIEADAMPALPRLLATRDALRGVVEQRVELRLVDIVDGAPDVE